MSLTSAARLFLVLALSSGCTGEIASDETPEGTTPPGAPGARPPSTGAPAPGPGAGPSTPGAAPAKIYPVPVAELRRLTRREYDNTVRDLLGDSSSPARAFGPDAVGAVGYEAPGAVGSLEFDGYMQAAEKLAANAVGRLASLLACTPKAPAEEEACAASFIQRFA